MANQREGSGEVKSGRREWTEIMQLQSNMLNISDPNYATDVTMAKRPDYAPADNDAKDQYRTDYCMSPGVVGMGPATKGFTPKSAEFDWMEFNASALSQTGSMEPNKSKTPPTPGGRTG